MGDVRAQGINVLAFVLDGVVPSNSTQSAASASARHSTSPMLLMMSSSKTGYLPKSIPERTQREAITNRLIADLRAHPDFAVEPNAKSSDDSPSEQDESDNNSYQINRIKDDRKAYSPYIIGASILNTIMWNA
jgi:hypothetical protein